MKNQQHKHNPATDLIIAWSTGFFSGVTLFIGVILLVGVLLSGLPALSDASPTLPQILLIILVFLCSIFLSPLLLGVHWYSFKKGLRMGIVSLLCTPIAFWGGWQIWGLVWNNSFWIRKSNISFTFIVPTLASIAIISIVILMSAQKITQILKGVFVGFVVSIILSAFIEFVFGNTILSGDSIFHILWIVPPIVWVTVVYFVQLARGERGWTTFATWAGLIALSYVLPLIISQTPLWLFR